MGAGAIGVGIDFGTTNSSVAVAKGGRVALATFPTSAAYRSVLYFDAEERGRDRKPLSAAGPGAIERYLAAGGDGRLIQSIKSYLASRTFQATSIFGFTFTLEDLVARLLSHLGADARASAGELTGPVVVGRPVRLAGAETPDDEAMAIGRLTRALGRAGFPAVTFEYEPVGAAYHYEGRLDHDELVLIADFGGGTSDFCLARVGPGARGGAGRILGTEGVALAGDSFDRQIVRRLVAPALGKGSHYLSHGKRMPVPPWLYGHLERWHHLSFLKSRENLKLLGDIHEGSDAPERIAALLHLVDADLGYALYRAVERTKIELSSQTTSRLVFLDDPIAIDHEVTRADFESWIAEELERIASAVDRLLAACAVRADEVDRVFMTGGSSLVPAVRAIFTARFGAARLAGGDELTSVASGLALRAADAGAKLSAAPTPGTGRSG